RTYCIAASLRSNSVTKDVDRQVKHSGGEGIERFNLKRIVLSAALNREVFRLRVVDDDRRGRLLRVELVFLAELDADRLGAEQRQELGLVGEVRAGRIAERVAAAAIALRQHLVVVARLLSRETELAADALVDVFGERLGHLDREAVQVQVV